ncbi:hypothetical protein MBLNU230_g8388t1 [Neophaeotheca triangularis]
MPSHLTRQVFRRLAANEPLVFSGCLRRRPQAGLAPLVRRRRDSPLHIGQSQRRNFFNFDMFRRATKDVTEPELDPGVDTMVTFAKMQRLRARLPPVEDLEDALTKFFEFKFSKGQSIEDMHADVALKSLEYCLSQNEEFAGRQSGLDFDTLFTAIKVLARPPRQSSSAHAQLASVIYNELRQTYADKKGTWVTRAAGSCAMALCYTGRLEEARDLLLANDPGSDENIQNGAPKAGMEAEEAGPNTSTPKRGIDYVKFWSQVLWAFSRQGNEGELLRTESILEERGIQMKSRLLIEPLLTFYCSREDSGSVKKWWAAYSSIMGHHSQNPFVQAGRDIDGRAVGQVLRWCLRHGELDLGHSVIRDMMKANPTKPVWDAIFIWAAGTKKSVDEIGRMFGIMEQSNSAIQDPKHHRIPDIATINGLVDFAISQKDPYMAERFITLGRERGIHPDARTFVLQIEYRLAVGDVDGALVAYKNLQGEDLSANEDLSTVNKLLVALCTSGRHDFETIMAVAGDLSDRRARFEPLTVSTLSVLHLSRNEIHDTVDLLNTHTVHYSTAERTVVRSTLIDYCLSPDTPTPASWDAYNILKTIFDETARPEREKLMANFFSTHRNRPDMAVHIFNHMRAHTRPDTLPTTDTYVAAFMGAAKLRDIESLEVVHNQLKLDFNIQLNTYVYNALILAYTACGRPRQGLDFWDDIVASREGPTYNSIHIALRACEKAPFGDLKAQELWARLKRNNVELDQSMWASYAAALAGNGDNELAIGTLETAELEGECVVDTFVVGSLFAGCPGQSKQAEVEEWCLSSKPGVWKELVEEIGVVEREDEMRYFKIDRAVAP